MDTMTMQELADIEAETLERTPIALRALRDGYGMKNKDLAAALGKNLHWVTERTATDGTKLSFPEARMIAHVFGCPVDLLYADRTEVLRWTLDHPNGLRTSWNTCSTAA